MNHLPAGTRGEPDARERARPVRRADRGNGPSERRHRVPVRPYFFGWLTHCRRLARDYEREPTYSEAWVYLAETHRLLKHLAPDTSLPLPYQRRRAA
jgi:transposase